ncbi:MAG: glycosyl hydrolase-related protein [Candidatus Hydrogenedentes bacterium]|nr:glycosyl hydrolase-related protein [Candidatus Hydrogenedentota bacterium]
MSGGSAKKKTIHLIGHAHIDPIWLWDWREGFSEVRSTFKSVISLMKQYPEWKFTAGSSSFYEWIQETEPDFFEELRKRISEGRWEYVGCFYVEPDCNLPCGESFVRHGLLSQLYFEEMFGRRTNIGFAPDSFGHAGSLPQILKKLGIDFYVFMRPSPPLEKKYENGTTFIWESPSGVSVIASVIPESYGGNVKEVLSKINNIDNYPFWVSGQQDFLCFFGVGNHGGGPTKETIEVLLKLKKESRNFNIQFSTLKSFFDGIAESNIALPKLREGLYHHARGCYSVNSTIKKLNRETEHLLITAEKFATIGWSLGILDYPTESLKKSWKNLLFCQFHDVLAGTCIRRSYDDVIDFLGYSRCVSKNIVNTFVQSLSKEIDTEENGRPLILFNPLPWDVSGVTVISEFISRDITGGIEVINELGETIPFQILVGDRPGGKELAIEVNVPSLGYRLYSVREGRPKRGLNNKDACKISFDHINKSLENDRWRILINSQSGGIKSVIDKELGLEIAKDSFIPVPILDSSDTWGHDIDELRVEAGCFKLIDQYMLDLGEVLANYVQIFEFGFSKVFQKITVYSTLPYIDVSLGILWNERYTALKWVLDSNVQDGIATYEVPYCAEVREATGEEEPAQQWIDLSGKVLDTSYGISIITDSNYGYDIKDNVMRVTLLRSPAYAHHNPARVNSKALYQIVDQGYRNMKLRVFPHKGNWQSANTPREAFQFNIPLIPQFEPNHTGLRKPVGTFLKVDQDNVIISAIKRSEFGNSIIIRAYETLGLETTCNFKLNFLGLDFESHFSPFEIKTFKIADGEVKETNLLED